MPGAEAYSAARYAAEARAAIAAAEEAGSLPIVVGGTGLYFRALLQGLSAMPPVPDEIRARWRAALVEQGAPALHAILQERDPHAAGSIRPTDGQRIVRALEVHDASGLPISHWQRQTGKPLVDKESARLIVIEPDRAELGRRINARFDGMVKAGAIEEARGIAALGVDAAMPAMKAIGVRELLAADRGETSLEEAIEKSKTATRQYAKRQSTWFRNQLDANWQRIRHAE